MHDSFQRPKIIIDLLQRHDVEPRDNLGDVVVCLIKPRTVAEFIGVKVTDVPRRQQQIVFNVT